MTKAMQTVLNQFIETNASVTTMHEVMEALHDVEEWQRVVNVYRKRGMYEYSLNGRENLESAKEECSRTLLRAGIEYSIEDLLTL